MHAGSLLGCAVKQQDHQAWVEGGAEQRHSHAKVLSGFHGELWTGMDLQRCPKLRKGGQDFGCPLLTSIAQSGIQDTPERKFDLGEGDSLQEKDSAESWQLPNSQSLRE